MENENSYFLNVDTNTKQILCRNYIMLFHIGAYIILLISLLYVRIEPTQQPKATQVILKSVSIEIRVLWSVCVCVCMCS